MSRDAKTAFDWADGNYTFRLGLGEIEELQEKTGCGPYFLLNRMRSGEWRVGDLRETIRLGLIGGGLEPSKAFGLVKKYVDARPLLENLNPAMAIISAAVIGAPDGEAPGKAKAVKAKGKQPNPKTESSPLPHSTELAPH